jgi:hypothetical protein
MPSLRLKAQSGEYVDFPIAEPQFVDDTLIYFVASIKGTAITDGNGVRQILVLRRTDMSAEDWTAMLGRLGGGGAIGGALGGPIGLAIGGFAGLMSFARSRPSTTGYYLINDENNDTCILAGVITKKGGVYKP